MAAIDLTKLNSPETAPDDGRQFAAWGIDLHAQGYRQPDDEPRWCIVQWSPDYIGGDPFWRWSVPGRSTSIEILGWVELPWNDRYGNSVLTNPPT